MPRNAGDNIKEFYFAGKYSPHRLWELVMAGKIGLAWLQKSSLDKLENGMPSLISSMTWAYPLDILQTKQGNAIIKAVSVGAWTSGMLYFSYKHYDGIWESRHSGSSRDPSAVCCNPPEAEECCAGLVFRNLKDPSSSLSFTTGE